MSNPHLAIFLFFFSYIITVFCWDFKKIFSDPMHTSSLLGASGKINYYLCSCCPLCLDASSSPPRWDILMRRVEDLPQARSCWRPWCLTPKQTGKWAYWQKTLSQPGSSFWSLLCDSSTHRWRTCSLDKPRGYRSIERRCRRADEGSNRQRSPGCLPLCRLWWLSQTLHCILFLFQ